MTDTYGYHDPADATRADAEVTVHDGLERAEPRSPLQRGETLGRYVVLDTLGAGGMGIVLAAYDTQLNRRVALKLLHAHTSQDPENHARLLREAQALAKLSHPRVVSVYDVGELRDQVFIAMEFIDGPNLRQWLRAQTRTPAQILAVFRGAGKGLQAAHDAGIVHRDFKPDNVLIGPDGKAYVTDFGLAHEANAGPELPETPSGSVSRSASSWLTETGTIMGTPAYMPIEQHAGLPTDHRSDQFSFCVSLFEALSGVRPFSGANANELCVAIGRAKLPASPKGVPRNVHRALVRGLAAKAEDRFESMRDLLRALAPRTRQSRTWIVGGLVGLGLGGALVAVSDPTEPPCAATGQRVREVYGPDQRRALQTAFTQTGLTYAQASFNATAETLETFTAAWATSAQDACLASERGAQSGEMLDLRMLCLDRGLHALSATLEILSAPEPGDIRESAKIAGGLPDLTLCDDLDALPKFAVLPATPEQTQEAETLLPVVERIRTLVIADRHDEAQALLEAHAAEFEASTYPLVKTLYLTWNGRYLLDRNDPRASEVLEEAHVLALEYGLYGEASRTANAIASRLVKPSQIDIATRWFASATALARAANSTRLEAAAAATSASCYSDVGRHDQAVEQSQHALDLTEGDADYPARARAELLLSHAEALLRRDGGNAGHEQIREARALIGELDADAPVIARIETKLSERATLRADYAAARRHSEEALRIVELHFGSRSRRYAAMLSNLAIPLKELGLFDEALDRFKEAFDILDEANGSHYGRCQILANMANLLWTTGEFVQMRQRLDQLDALVAEHQYEETEAQALGLQLRSALERAEGNLEQSRMAATQGLRIVETLFGENHYRSADARTTLAHVELEAGNHALARRLIERARQTETTVPGDRGRTSFILARTLWEPEGATAADRQQAIELARSAIADFEGAPSYAPEAATARAWLQARDEAYESSSVP